LTDPRLYAPAVLRNSAPILDILRRILPESGLVLELASGSGEHGAYFAAALPHLEWQPSDRDSQALASIDAHRLSGPSNLRPAVALDATSAGWPVAYADAMVCINMIHISPWSACQGLMTGAQRTLPAGGVLYLYGPYKQGGRHAAPSNAAFDESLRSRDPTWGVRELDDVIALAARHGLLHSEKVEMPANNLSVVFRKT
jgi:Protein of unknown function (DUF938)